MSDSANKENQQVQLSTSMAARLTLPLIENGKRSEKGSRLPPVAVYLLGVRCSATCYVRCTLSLLMDAAHNRHATFFLILFFFPICLLFISIAGDIINILIDTISAPLTGCQNVGLVFGSCRSSKMMIYVFLDQLFFIYAAFSLQLSNNFYFQRFSSIDRPMRKERMAI